MKVVRFISWLSMNQQQPWQKLPSPKKKTIGMTLNLLGLHNVLLHRYLPQQILKQNEISSSFIEEPCNSEYYF
jgi:hypothetical protein